MVKIYMEMNDDNSLNIPLTTKSKELPRRK